jgi:general secretion pathway protein K
MTREAASPRAQTGFVLVNTLILIAALSLVALKVLQDSERSRRTLAAAQTSAQLEMLGDAGVALAAALLHRDFNANGFDHPDEPWHLDRHRVESDQGSVRVTVRDLQGRLNVNLVTLDASGGVARALGGFLDAADVPRDSAEAILERFADPPAAGAGLDGRAGSDTFEKGDVVHLAEFASVPQVDRATLGRLRPLLVALPRGRGVNVNTASREVLASILADRPEQVAAALAARDARPFEDIADFREFVGGPDDDGTTLPLQALSVQSFWFEVTTEAKIGSDTRRVRTILVRDTVTGETRVFSKSQPEVP